MRSYKKRPLMVNTYNTFPPSNNSTVFLQFSLSVVSDSLRSHELQHARPPCPSPTPGVHSNSRPSSLQHRDKFCVALLVSSESCLYLNEDYHFNHPPLLKIREKDKHIAFCFFLPHSVYPGVGTQQRVPAGVLTSFLVPEDTCSTEES